MMLGIAADVADVGGQVDEGTMGEMATAAVVAMTNNILSKSYMTGLASVIQAFEDPDRYGEALVRSYASSMLPMSSFMRDIRKSGDPYMREVRSVMDAMMNTVPGFSDDLPARRSWITGEPLQYPQGWGGADQMSDLGASLSTMNPPIVQGVWKQDPVLDELAKLNFAFSAPPTRKVMGVELSPEQYARLNELHGTVRSGRYTMHQRLERLFETNRYQGYPPTEVSDPSVDPRVKEVQRVISAYREAARRELMKEYPELKDAVIASKRELRSNARLGLSGIADLAQ